MPQKWQTWATEIFCIYTGLFLVVGALHIYTDYGVIRLGILFGFMGLAILAFTQHYPRWGLLMLALGVVFNPFSYLNLNRDLWELLDLLALAPVILFGFRATNSYDKGVRFEQYVSTLFPASDYEIENRTRDISKFSKRRVRSDMDPDFVFRNKKDGRLFAVECKWRAKWAGDSIKGFGLYWNLEQAARYKDFGIRNQMPVFVCFGISGRPDKPREVYSLPLEELRWSFLKQSLIRQGRRMV